MPKKIKDNQDYLRQMTRLAKAYDKDYSYRNIADTVGITESAIYNWLNGQYKLSSNTEKVLYDLLIDVISE